MRGKRKEKLILIKRFLLFMKGSLLKYLGSVFATAIAVTMTFLTPLVISASVDAVTQHVQGAGSINVDIPFGIGNAINRIGGSEWLAGHMWAAALMLLAFALIGGTFQFLRGKWTAEASEKIAERMRVILYDHLQSLPYDYHVKAETGDLIQRCTNDVDMIRRFLANQLNEVFRAILMLVLALTFMLRIHVKLTLISLILIPPVFLLAIWFFHWVEKLFTQADAADGRMTAMLQESLTGVRVVRAFGRQKYESDRFDVCSDDLFKKWVDIGKYMAVYWSGSDGLCMLQTGITLACGIFFALRGEISTGNIIVFISYISMLIWPIREMGRILSDFGKSLVSLRRLYEVIDTPVEEDTPGASDADLYTDITFDHVAFSYDKKTPVLSDVSFTVKAGATVAILGATGSGKSTMMHLLQRLYDPDSGEIRFGKREIRIISKDCLRDRVGYILQEPFLYSRSIRENIIITSPDASQQEIDRVTHDTASDGFIAEFREGYDTLVGERGVTLSGGQKQRIAIARTLMRKNDVLILDDSLSAVDTQTDKMIRESLLSAKEKGERTPTTFIISHRITTLADADLIIVLSEGRIAQQGTHAQLIAQEGLYRHVYRIQAALEEELAEETA